ncbi:MAG: GDP-mannose 4,6-dehydratase [bacterium]
MRVLMTGISGFVGSHLAEFALAQGAEVFGTVWPDRAGEELPNLSAVRDRLTLFPADLTDEDTVTRVLQAARPEVIFHLAAQTFVPDSWAAPVHTLQTNILPEVHLFERTRALGLDPIIHIAGSSEEYGLAYPDECPIKETNPLRPLSPYGVSKVTQDLLACQYWHSHRTRAVVTRAFNHEGPRRGRHFVTSAFARQIARIEAGLQDPAILVGNLEAVRDFTDVRDVVRAYWLAVQRCECGSPYNIGTGEGHPIREVLATLLDLTMLGSDVAITPDPARMRPSDVPRLVADASRFRQATGWTPAIPFRSMLRDTLAYWRERVARERVAAAVA